MIVNITCGQEIIDILSDGFVTCLKIRKPVAIDWYDCAGSAGKYYAFTANYQPEVQHFNEVLVNGDDGQVFQAMQDFLHRFRSGQYSVYIDRNPKNDFELHLGYEKQPGTPHYNYGYYNPLGDNAVFTQPHETVNAEQVAWYEQLIAAGARPKAILFQASFSDEGAYEDGSSWISSLESPLFILDGHHKLLAYKNLGITPEYVLIKRDTTGLQEFSTRGYQLYLEYDYFLSDHARRHIIGHHPILLTGQSTAVDNYNRQFDQYLCTAGRIETAIVQLFKAAWESREKEKTDWLFQKLSILEKRENREKLCAYFFEISSTYPNGIWNYMNIASKQAFNTWVEKLLGTGMEAIKNDHKTRIHPTS